MRRALLPLGSALLVVLDGAAGSGLLVANAAAQVLRRDDDHPAPLIIAPSHAKATRHARGHGSHRSHSSHSSHYSGGGGGHSSGGSYSGASEPSPAPTPTPDPPPPPPPRPKLARVSITAVPGGQIFIDGKPYGRDATDTLFLKPGTYVVKVTNRFIGEHTKTVEVADGQTGVITIDW